MYDCPSSDWRHPAEFEPRRMSLTTNECQGVTLGPSYWVYDDDGSPVPECETPEYKAQMAAHEAACAADTGSYPGVDDWGFPNDPAWNSMIDCDAAIEAAADAALDAEVDDWWAKVGEPQIGDEPLPF